MAKKQSSFSRATGVKVSFGKRREGKAAKRLNKHKSVGKRYRGQGR
jgi:hypothetical protein